MYLKYICMWYFYIYNVYIKDIKDLLPLNNNTVMLSTPLLEFPVLMK